MLSLTMEVLVWAAAVGSGLMAGVYAAFSGFIMRSFAGLPPADAVAAMNAINTTIVRSAFMPLFFGSTLVSVLLIIAGLLNWLEPWSLHALGAGTTYLTGMFLVTVFANVPLNNALAAAGNDDAGAHQAWQAYQTRWTRWNTVRAVASTLSLVICIDLLAG